MIRLPRTRAILRRILPDTADSFLRFSILGGAEAAAAEGIGWLAVFARVIDKHADRLTDPQLEAISGALAEDLPMDAVEDEGLAALVRDAFEEGGVA